MDEDNVINSGDDTYGTMTLKVLKIFDLVDVLRNPGPVGF